MKYKILSFGAIISCLIMSGANANWQYPGNYLGDGYYADDGSRFVLALRGGASITSGSIKNEIGALTSEYFVNSDGGVISGSYFDACTSLGGCGDYYSAGLGELADLPSAENLSGFSVAAGLSVGWTVPHSPQWRIELGWDHIAETDYNSSPLFDGDLKLDTGVNILAQSGGVNSTIATDIISVVAFYDFFDGVQKPLRTVIPYVGFGAGYADAKTVMTLSDLYGDLSSDINLQNFGELDSYGVLQFYKSEKRSSNIAGILALGLSYGLSENMYLDFGARVSYVPKIKFALSSEDATKQRDWFSATGVLYTNIMVGVRLEF